MTNPFVQVYDNNSFGQELIPADNMKEVTTMAYKITDACISCGACAEGCPVSAITEGDGKYEINADLCIDCGACADVCPVSAPEA